LDHFDPTTGFWPESRVFSIAQVNGERSEASIVYSVKGSYTGRMEKELKSGMEVWIKAPFGEFIIPNFVGPGETAVLIAGGTGLAPFIPFIDSPEGTIPVQLFYGLRSPELLLFGEELTGFSKKGGNSLHLFLEEDGSPDLDGAEYEKTKGSLSIPVILNACGNGKSRIFFLSGPPGMIESFRTELIGSGIEDSKIIIDEWS
jgi:ferredoxin-NADP reductase